MICLAIWCYEFLIVYLLQLCILCITKNILNKQNIYFFSTFGIETFRDGNFGFKADFQYGLPALLAGHMTAWVFYDCSLAETNIAQLILHFHNLESGIVVYELSEIRLLLTNQIIYNLAFPIASFQQHNTPMTLHCCFLLDSLSCNDFDRYYPNSFIDSLHKCITQPHFEWPFILHIDIPGYLLIDSLSNFYFFYANLLYK